MTFQEMYLQYQREAVPTKRTRLKMWSITKNGTTYTLIEQNPYKSSVWARLSLWCKTHNDDLDIIQISRTASISLEKSLREQGEKADGYIGVMFYKPEWDEVKVAMYNDYSGSNREAEAQAIIMDTLGEQYANVV